jgi:geranylgeranyl pyrophosphate synthase
MTNIHAGQGWDIHWHNKKNYVPRESQYFHMVENKTGVLPRLLLRMICELTSQDKETSDKVVSFMNKLGSVF